MSTLGKRTRTAREGVDREKLYPLTEAVKMVKERAKAKFDETVEVSMNLGVDPRHADQMVRGVVSLPNGSGRSVRVGGFGGGRQGGRGQGRRRRRRRRRGSGGESAGRQHRLRSCCRYARPDAAGR